MTQIETSTLAEVGANSSILIFAALSVLMMSMLALDLFAASARERGVKSWVVAANLSVPVLLGITLMSATFARGPINSTLDLYKSGANYPPAVSQNERDRIVTTASVESRRMHAVAAGIAIAGFGIALTWSLSLFAFLSIAASILLLIELAFVFAEPAGLRFGSLEWLTGLGLAAAWITFHKRSRERQRSLPIAWSVGALSLTWLAVARATSQTLDPSTGVDLQNSHEGLLVLSIFLGIVFARLALRIEQGVGPRWEAAYLHSFVGVSIGALTAAALLVAPRGIDRLEVLAQIDRTQLKVQGLIHHHLGDRQIAGEQIQLPAQLWFEIAKEYRRVGELAIHNSSAAPHIDPDVDPYIDPYIDKDTRQQLAHIESLAQHAETLALIEDAKSQLLEIDKNLNVDPRLATRILQKFWSRTYPSLEANVEAMPHSGANSGEVQTALRQDLASITAAAIELEVRRTDLWLAWVSRLAPERRASMAVAAQDYSRRLKGLRPYIASTGLEEDPRLTNLDMSLSEVSQMTASLSPDSAPLISTLSSPLSTDRSLRDPASAVESQPNPSMAR